jgi:hypothetical protein
MVVRGLVRAEPGDALWVALSRIPETHELAMFPVLLTANDYVPWGSYGLQPLRLDAVRIRTRVPVEA